MARASTKAVKTHDVKIGDKITIVKSPTGSGYSGFQGRLFEVTSLLHNTYKDITAQPCDGLTSAGTYTFYVGDYKKMEETQEELLEKVTELEKEVEEIHKKIAWMKAVKAEKFDETEFKVWTTLQVLNDKKISEYEKAKVIAQLINQ